MKRPHWMTNRQAKRRKKPGLFWCWGCDANHVSSGGRCKVCGYRDWRKRDKKGAKEDDGW